LRYDTNLLLQKKNRDFPITTRVTHVLTVALKENLNVKLLNDQKMKGAKTKHKKVLAARGWGYLGFLSRLIL
jgi:hypothetical protein